ncbi:MAG: hypothetical protein P4K83_12715 [Terracidiphilus sp.]|nr:hypothetical protein [Terracidiphilus sp.]
MNLRSIAPCAIAAAILLFGINAAQAQNQTATPAASHSESTAHIGKFVTIQQSFTISGLDGQRQLLDLLRETPTVAGAVARDPSLLGEQSYIQRTNPKLAAFLAAHPEVARNPDYYLFTNMQGSNGNRTQALERQLWPEYLHGSSNRDDAINAFINDSLAPIIIIPAVFFALAWGLRSLVQSRRQSKQLKAQSDLQTRLIDKFGSAPELAAYLATDAGQKLLGFGVGELGVPQQSPLPFTFARILRPLQTGALLVLLAGGIFAGHWLQPDSGPARVWLAILLLAAGLGVILSAGIAWTMAKKFGILPDHAKAESTSAIDRP